MDSTRVHALRHQIGLDIGHEAEGPADVVLGGRIVQEEALVGVELIQVDAALVVVVDALDLLLLLHLGEEHAGLDIRVLGEHIADVAAEGAHLGAVRAVHPGDRAPRPRGDGAVQDRDHGRDADAGGDQRERRLALGGQRGGVDEELARRVRQLDDVALLVLRVQPVRDQPRDAGVLPALLPLHADAVVVAAGRVAQRVLPRLEVPELGDEDVQADVLARAEQGQRPPVLGREVEARDLRRLGDLALDAEAPPPLLPAPAVAVGVEAGVQLRLAPDEDVGERPVRRGPGLGHGGRHGGGPQHRGHGRDQELAHDGVLGRRHAQARVLVRDALHGRGQPPQVVHVGRVGEHGARQRPRLPPRRLARVAEDVVQLRVRPQHVAVEERRDLHAVLPEEGRRRFHDGDLGRRDGGCYGCHGWVLFVCFSCLVLVMVVVVVVVVVVVILVIDMISRGREDRKEGRREGGRSFSRGRRRGKSDEAIYVYMCIYIYLCR